MMADREPRPEDWEILGVPPGTSIDQVASAYRRRRSLYSEEALASYMLLEDDERTALLARLEEAWKRISTSQTRVASGASAPLELEPEADAAAPDPEEHPGAYLRYQRIRRGLSLEAVAAETKIRPSLLTQLENDSFDETPAPVYVRGFVLQVARTLGLAEAENLAAAYLKHLP